MEELFSFQDKTVVYTNGCFDVLHSGHIELLKFAKSLGDILVVGLNSDNSIKVLKGDSRPFKKQDERALILESLSFVDYVLIYDEIDPYNQISEILPDVLVKGEDYFNKEVVGSNIVEDFGGEVYYAPFKNGYSSSNTIGKINECCSI